jgi:Calcineurin-like phosphoesterase
MKKLAAATALLSAAVFSNVAATAVTTTRNDQVTIAVFGDWPYADARGNRFLLKNAPLLINSVNADPDVSLVIHVGDIHSGSEPCTSAGILPPIATSIPDWNQGIFYQFQQFAFPVVYTPGDNEWTDCHKSKQLTSGHPLKELASVRQLFFSQPGHALGGQDKQVASQATGFDPAPPRLHNLSRT